MALVRREFFVDNSEYFRWLCSIVDADEGNGYLFLMHHMFKSRFNPGFGNDINRAEDGMMLRDIFIDELHYYPSDTMDCSFLEALIGIATRLEDMTDTPMVEWFWVLLENIGLTEFDDIHYHDFGGPDHINAVIETVNQRLYDEDGVHGLFPLSNPREDQRRVEIWYQMSAYLKENYRF